MKAKTILLLLVFLVIVSSASAFRLQTTAGTEQLPADASYRETRDDYTQNELAGSAGDGLYTLTVRHRANREAILSSTPTISLSGEQLGLETGDYVFTLEGLKPTTWHRGETRTVKNRCADRCETGPKALIVVTRDGRIVCNGEKGYKAVYGAAGFHDQIECLGKVRYRITNIQAPEYKETFLKVGGNNQTWYLLLGPTGVKSGMQASTPKDIIVDYCISLKINGSWSDCVESAQELAPLTQQGSPVSEPLPPQTAPSIVQEIRENTQTASEQTDSVVGETQVTTGKVAGIPSSELERCTRELKEDVLDESGKHLLVSKARFRYDSSIGYPPGATGWNEFATEELADTKVIQIDLRGTGYRDPDKGLYEFVLCGFKPREINLSGVETIAPEFETCGFKDDEYMLCGLSDMTLWGRRVRTQWTAFNDNRYCDARNPEVQRDAIVRVYKYEAPYFKETTPEERSRYGKNEILVKGPHCFDVWAYYMIKFRESDSGGFKHTWWMKTQEEVQNYLESSQRGYNLEVTVVEEDGSPIHGASVTVSGMVEGEQFTETETTVQGKTQFIVPINTEITVTASKETYREASTTVTVTDTESVTITLIRNLYNMKVAFARDDFWKLYYEVAPYYYNESTTPIDTTTTSFLDSHAPQKSDYDYLYSKVPEFLSLKTRPCDDQSGETVNMRISTDLEGTSIRDYRNYVVQLYYVMVFERLLFGETYYACFEWPTESGIKTREITWQITENGSLNETNVRDIP